VELAFYFAAAVAVIATLFAITNYNPVHALLYLIVSLLAVAMVFFSVGAPFAGVLEVIIYAGAIMVLFVFVVMMLNLGKATVDQERRWLAPRTWLGPGVLSLALLCELVWVLGGYGVHVTAGGRAVSAGGQAVGAMQIGAVQVGVALFGPYVLAVELASMLLLAGLVAAFHLGRHE
jgi:NADH-quinone oxidoreductase subunit J